MSFLDKIKGAFKRKPKNPDDMVRYILAGHGDDGTKLRTVDHLAIFETEHEAAAYMTLVLDRGYDIRDNEVSAYEHGVEFNKDSAVVGKEFDDELMLLRVQAARLNGTYDGWGCPVAT